MLLLVATTLVAGAGSGYIASSGKDETLRAQIPGVKSDAFWNDWRLAVGVVAGVGATMTKGSTQDIMAGLALGCFGSYAVTEVIRYRAVQKMKGGAVSQAPLLSSSQASAPLSPPAKTGEAVGADELLAADDADF